MTKSLLLGALLALGSLDATAQTSTNAIPGPLDALSTLAQSVGLSTSPTNYAVAPFVGWGAHGKLAAGALIIENVNKNVGLVGGFDHLWFGGKAGSANLLSGGLSLQQVTHPLSFLGTNSFETNFTATPYGLVLVATPTSGTSNNGGLAGIARAGVNVDFYTFSDGWKVSGGLDYGNRTGAGNYSGNYFDAFFAFRKNF